MITTDSDIKTTCATCGEPSVIREFFVEHLGQSRRYAQYETHADCMTDQSHFDALVRMEKFFAALDALQKECQERVGEIETDLGTIIHLDLGSVRPSACGRRTQMVAIATVKAFGQSGDVQTSPEPLVGATVEQIVAALKPLVNDFAIEARDRRKALEAAGKD